MNATAPHWIGCGQAEKLVKSLTEEPASGSEAFRALLRLALLGHVRIVAEEAEARLLYETTKHEVSEELDFNDPHGHAETRRFLQKLIQRYGSSESHPGFSCFLTGTFEFGEFHKLDQQDVLSSFHVTGLKFDRTDIINRFGAPDSLKAPQRQVKAGGRPRKWDWDGALIHIIAVANSHEGLQPGETLQVSHIAKLMAEWFSSQSEDGSHPDDSDLRKVGRRIVNEIELLSARGN